MKRFSPVSIVIRHFKTLHREGYSKPSVMEYAFFSVIPILVSIGVGQFYQLSPDSNTTRIIITAFAVFAGLFLNLLAMIYNIFDRSFQKNNITNNFGEDRKMKLFMFEEAIHNIAFGVLVSILVVIFTLPLEIFGHYSALLVQVLNYIIFALLTVFIFTVLMVLKRLDNLVANEIVRKLRMLEEAEKEANKPAKKSKKK